MTRRAMLSGVNVCVALFLLVASSTNAVGNELDGARGDAAARFLDGGETAENGATSPTEAPRIENFANGDAISYSLALLRGTAPGVERGTVVVENLSSSRATRVTRAPVVDGRFKVLVELASGENRLTLAVGDSRIDFFLTRRPDDNPRFVRLIYFVDSTGDEAFATPEFWTTDAVEVAQSGASEGDKTVLEGNDGTPGAAEIAQNGRGCQNEAAVTDASTAETARTRTPPSNNFRAKIGTAALLWQTATAERLNDAGYGRRTFSLELDEAGDPVVWVLRGKKKAAQYAALSETERFRAIYREIEASELATEFARYFVSVAFARKSSEIEGKEATAGVGETEKDALDQAVETAKAAEDERIKRFLTITAIGATGENAATGEGGSVAEIAERGRPGSTWARVALGGGSVAALDASTLFSWPDSPVDVADAFADARPIAEDFAADSGFRRTRWALTASTLGAGLHELGHAFGLDHSQEPTDFMSRGFDRFNRIFTVVEPPDATTPNAVESVFADESAATWTPESANRLIRSRWIEK